MLAQLKCALALGTLMLIVKSGGSSRPEISVPWRRETRYIIQGTDVDLECRAVAQPDPRYVWFKDDQEINSTNSFEMNPVHGNMTIHDFTSREEGHYTCKAQSIDGMDMSPAITLYEAKLGYSWDVPTLDESVMEGDPLSLTCRNPPLSVPKGKITWHKNKGELELTDRMRIDQTGTLHFAYTENSDSGEYNCKMYNPVLEMMKLGSKVVVKIKKNNQGALDMKPRLMFASSDHDTLLNRELKLECIFSGSPLPKVSWKYNDVLISKTAQNNVELSSDGELLTIKKVSEKSTGKYSCTGTNRGGTESKSIYVTVKSGPIWLEAPDKQVVLVGNDAKFSCKARSVGPSSPLLVTWLHEWSPVSDSRLTISDDKTMLKIHNVAMGDNDCVQCNVSNDIDYIIKNACLRVVNDTNDLPKTTTVITLADEIPSGDVKAEPESVQDSSASKGGLVAGLVITVVIAVAVGIIATVIWKRRQTNQQYLTILRVKDPNDDFAEKAKRRQTV